MVESFGARLRQRREEQGIALDTIAARTKIKASLLQALERDDVSHWPSGIFRRAFIRAYAQAIGLDPDAVLREFLEVHPEPADVAAPIIAADPGDGAAPPTRLGEMLSSAFESLFRVRRTPAVESLQLQPARRERAAAEPTPVEPDPIGGIEPVGGVEPVSAEPIDVEASIEPPEGEPAPMEPPPVERTSEVEVAVEVEAPPPSPPALMEPDLEGVAQLCTELGCVKAPDEVRPLLSDAARLLNAMGVIVWLWEPAAAELRPALAYGYSEKVLARLPIVRQDADNATAAAFRSGQTCTISGSGHSRSALAVPMLTPAGCAGVLAFELRHGSEQTAFVRAAASIFAAVLARAIGGDRRAELAALECRSMA
jgi:transcriptional regulator with XRE-family HTH domain